MKRVSWTHGALLALGIGVFACGSRSPLSLPTESGSGGAGAVAGAGGSGGIEPILDRCVSATAGPASMWRNCSSRDGRSRVPVPVKPRLTWTQVGATKLGPAVLTTGPESDVYVVSGKFNSSQGSIRRLGAAGGAEQWALDIEITDATAWPVFRSTGVIDVFARDAEFNPALLQIDAQSGAFATTNFGFDFYSGPPNPAVGADGSLYLVHSENVGTVSEHTFFSRVRSDGVVSWTTPDLAFLVATSADTKLQSPSTLALGAADRVFTVVSTITAAGTGGIVLALDADSGAPLWQSEFLGQHLGGPAVRPDGSIAILLGPLEAARLVFLDAQSGTPTTHKLNFGGSAIHVITRFGDAIIATNEGKGATGLVAVDGDGKTRWTHAVPVRSATLGANDTLFVVGSTLLGLDSATGATRWELAPPNPESCILDGALTSSGKIVAVQCDGTVFGAAD